MTHVAAVRRVLGVAVLVAGCAGSNSVPGAPTPPSSVPNEGIIASSPAQQQPVAVQPVATGGWVTAGWPVQVLIPSDWNEQAAADYPATPGPDMWAKLPSGGRCALWIDGTVATDDAAGALSTFASDTARNLNDLPGEQWTLTPLLIPGVPAAAQLRSSGANGRGDLVAGIPLKSGGIGLFLLQCDPAQNDTVLAAVIASLVGRA